MLQSKKYTLNFIKQAKSNNKHNWKKFAGFVDWCIVLAMLHMFVNFTIFQYANEKWDKPLFCFMNWKTL